MKPVSACCLLLAVLGLFSKAPVVGASEGEAPSGSLSVRLRSDWPPPGVDADTAADAAGTARLLFEPAGLRLVALAHAATGAGLEPVLGLGLPGLALGAIRPAASYGRLGHPGLSTGVEYGEPAVDTALEGSREWGFAVAPLHHLLPLWFLMSAGHDRTTVAASLEAAGVRDRLSLVAHLTDLPDAGTEGDWYERDLRGSLRVLGAGIFVEARSLRDASTGYHALAELAVSHAHRPGLRSRVGLALRYFLDESAWLELGARALIATASYVSPRGEPAPRAAAFGLSLAGEFGGAGEAPDAALELAWREVLEYGEGRPVVGLLPARELRLSAELAAGELTAELDGALDLGVRESDWEVELALVYQGPVLRMGLAAGLGGSADPGGTAPPLSQVDLAGEVGPAWSGGDLVLAPELSWADESWHFAAALRLNLDAGPDRLSLRLSIRGEDAEPELSLSWDRRLAAP